MKQSINFAAAAMAAALFSAPLYAQAKPGAAKLDRTVQPTPGNTPTFNVPKWTKLKLSDGAELIVVEKHDLPLVTVNVAFVGGSYNYEPADKTGLASFTGQMMSEGTTTRTAAQFSDAQQALGTNINAGVGGESGSMGFTALKDRVPAALALMSDMLLHPAFPAEALELQRARILVNLTQAKDQPNSIAANLFARTLYGDAHPYGRVVTEKSIRAITRDDLVAFHKDYFRPGRAVITVTGDVRPAEIRAELEKALKDWPAGGERPSFDYPAAPAPAARTIYLVDKPKAAQSVFQIGIVGPPRSSPDYYAIAVMNNMLGGIFQSRLNHNIREVKGYSYGVSSRFAFGRGPGAFNAGGGIVTAKSDSALIEFVKEFKGVQGTVPFTDDEIKQGKESLTLGLPRRFSGVNSIAASVSTIYVDGLPDTYYQDYVTKINAVTKEDLARVAKKYLDMDHMAFIIVGDRATIEGPLRKTGIAPVSVVDADGKPIIVP